MSKEKVPEERSVTPSTSSVSPSDPRASEEFDGIPDDLDFQPALHLEQPLDSSRDGWHPWLSARVFGIHSGWDLAWLSVAIAVVMVSIWLSLADLQSGQDPAAPMNALLLGLLIASWATAMCSQIRTRLWGTGLAAAGFLIWALDVVYGAGGDVGALWDVFCRGSWCR